MLTKDLDSKLSEIEVDRIEDLAKKKAHSASLPYLSLQSFPIDNTALSIIDEAEARAAQSAIIARNGQALSLAVVDPKYPATIELIKNLEQKGFVVAITLVSNTSLERAYARYKLQGHKNEAVQGIIGIAETQINALVDQVQNLQDLKERITSLPITQVLDILIAGALKIGASDIHFEPGESNIRLRYRLDGVLTDIVTFAPVGYPDILSRIKLNSGLKINIHNVPQDGRFTIRQKNKDIEVRVSILPGAYGENIVMRILDPSTIRQRLEDLGMRDDTLLLIKKLLQKTTGTILTSGPTGSGKTTTLYAFIEHINSPDIKIITIEDPIEYHISGISQTQVNEQAGYSFVAGLRSIVRQDPDVILVGEIRDRETAEIGMQAALTGHLVLSTIHTNNAAGTIPRLIDLGIKPVTIAPAINASMAQRLVRRLCDDCKTKKTITKEDYEVLKKHLSKLSEEITGKEMKEDMELNYPGKCSKCNMTGYKGRIGVYEIFIVDPDMEKMILKSPALSELQELAVSKGMVTLLQDGLVKVIDGLTSVEEVMRVIGE